MFGYIYKTVIINPNSSLHQHFYIGQKQSPVFLDYYYGSGKKLRDYFNKRCNRKWSRHIYKEEAELLGLHREILAVAENIDELNSLEEHYVNKELNNPLCLNLMTGGLGRVVKKEVTESMAQTKRNAQYKWWTNGEQLKVSRECPGDGFVRGRHKNGYNWFTNGEHNVYCKECPVGFRLGTKPTTLGKTPWNKGLKMTNSHGNPIFIPWNKGLTKDTDNRIKNMANKNSIRNKGKHFSPRTEFKKGLVPWSKGKKGILKANSGSFHGEHKGMRWFNNGITQIRAFFKPEPDWVCGMLPQNKKQ